MYIYIYILILIMFICPAEMFARGDNFSDQHLPLLVEFLFPALLQILSAPQTYSERVRMHAGMHAPDITPLNRGYSSNAPFASLS